MQASFAPPGWTNFAPPLTSYVACPPTYAPITARRSLLKPSGTGSRPSAQKQPTSNPPHLGSMDTASVSTHAAVTNCSTGKSFTTCEGRRFSSNHGGGTTTQNDHTALWATNHRPRKPSSRWTKGLSCTNNQTAPLNGGRPIRQRQCRALQVQVCHALFHNHSRGWCSRRSSSRVVQDVASEPTSDRARSL